MLQNIYHFGDYNKEQIHDLIEVMREAKEEFGDEDINENLVLYCRPDAAPNPEEFMKTIPLDNVTAIVPDALSGKPGLVLTRTLTLAQLERIGKDGPVFLKEAIKINLEILKEMEPQDQSVAGSLDYIYGSPAWQLSL